jgi:hypothetical protein
MRYIFISLDPQVTVITHWLHRLHLFFTGSTAASLSLVSQVTRVFRWFHMLHLYFTKSTGCAYISTVTPVASIFHWLHRLHLNFTVPQFASGSRSEYVVHWCMFHMLHICLTGSIGWIYISLAPQAVTTLLKSSRNHSLPWKCFQVQRGNYHCMKGCKKSMCLWKKLLQYKVAVSKSFVTIAL